MFKKFAIAFLLFFGFFGQTILAQNIDFPLNINQYNFVNYDSNSIRYYGNTDNFLKFFSKVDSVVNFGKGQVNIVHIGGSHVQADAYTGQLRHNLQNLNGGQFAGRGLIFPYFLAKSNTPFGYKFDSYGNWETCRNVDRDRFCNLGMMGISAQTRDSISGLTFSFAPQFQFQYQFNSVRIYHRIDSFSFFIYLDSNLVRNKITNTIEGFTEFILTQYVDNLQINIQKTDSIQTDFELYGILPINPDPGVLVHNLGINGASTTSFLRCNKLEQQLKTINPDLIVFGLGINDAYGKNFNQDVFEINYDSLVARVRAANPDVAIIFSTNTDSYYKRKYINRNALLVQDAMQRLALRNDAAIWDMFEIMGGLNSIQSWKKVGLAKSDMVHFSREGYLLFGDLLTEALIKSWGNFLETGTIQNIYLQDGLIKN